MKTLSAAQIAQAIVQADKDRQASYRNDPNVSDYAAYTLSFNDALRRYLPEEFVLLVNAAYEGERVDNAECVLRDYKPRQHQPA